MNEFTVPLVSSASMNVFPQSTLSSFKNYFNEEINLEGDWRVALREIIFPAKINQVTKSDLKIFSSEGLKFYEKSIPFDAVSRPYGGERLLLELVPMKTVTIF